jgi:hypothetical protein
MPSRTVVAGILLFWLGMTTWYMVRERAFPWLREDSPARFRIELTDEVGVSTVNWKVFFQQKPVGQGRTETKMLHDRSFELSSHFRFDALSPVKNVEVKTFHTAYRVDREGNLLGISAKANVETFGLSVAMEMDDAVEEGKLTLHPKLAFGDQSVNAPPIGPVDLNKRGSILNPMHPMSRLPGLRAGMRWRVPLFDPIEASSSVPGLATLADAGPKELDAEVKLDDFEWNGENTPVYKIDYREPGKDRIVAGTWVRCEDALVLQQWAHHGQFELTLVRQK